MLIDVNEAIFLPINLQKLMLPIIQNSEGFVKNNTWLCKVARDLDCPVIPVIHKGLGDIIPEVKEVLEGIEPIASAYFSVTNEPEIMKHLEGKRQVIISGMEAHVNVLHSALDLINVGKKIFVVRNAVTSREKEDLDGALERLTAAGVTLISKEMLMFDILRRTDTEKYKTISQKYFHSK